MTLSTADLIAALTLATIWLGSLAGVWWRVSLQVHSVRRALYEHRVEMARELGSRVTVEMFDERFNRFEERFLGELRELRQAILEGVNGGRRTGR